MGDAAHRHASEFSWDATADGLAASYAAALARQRPGDTAPVEQAPALAWSSRGTAEWSPRRTEVRA
jgi:D-inositol-3-phosphate glycosyltransferase